MAKFFKERGNVFFRSLDRYAGIPLVFFFSLFRKKKALPDEIKHLEEVVFIKMSGIGDAVLTLPIIRALKDRYPEVEVSLICGKNNYVVYKNLLAQGDIDHLICIQYGRILTDGRYLKKSVQKIRSRKFDLTVDLDPWSRLSALISLLLKSDLKFGFKKEGQHKHYPFDYHHTLEQSEHEFEAYANLMHRITGDITSVPTYSVMQDDAIFFDEFRKKHSLQQYIVFHPWAAGYKNTLKELDITDIKYICTKLNAEGFPIIFTGGPTDEQKTNALAADMDNAFSVAGQTSLNETAVFLQNAACVISVNTGILHLAAAMDAHIVSINGPTDINRWGPLSNKAINIKSNLFCSPCLDLGFEYSCKKNGVPEGYCMKKIDLDGVIKAVKKMITPSEKNNKIYS